MSDPFRTESGDERQLQVLPRWRIHVTWAVVAVLATFLTWSSASVVLSSTAQPEPATSPATYTIARGEIGETASAQATISFREARAVAAGDGGTVTSIADGIQDGVEEGEVILTIDLRPVIAVEGTVPSFRSLSSGMTGADVAQLREFLGLTAGIQFDAATDRAVRVWQRAQGYPTDGIVRARDLAFFPSLPARVRLAEGTEVGTVLAPGATLFATLEQRPEITLIADNASRFSAGMAAHIAVPGAALEVEGVLQGPVRGEDGLDRYRVADSDGASACNEACASVLVVDAETSVVAEIETVARVEGLVVPIAALVTAPDGSTVLRDLAGGTISVEVIASSGGLAIVEGVDEGVVIQLFGDEFAP